MAARRNSPPPPTPTPITGWIYSLIEASCDRIAGYMRCLLVSVMTLTAAHAADYQLKATPRTVAWGYYWSAAKPVLRIKSGDTVTIQTMITNSPERLTAAGLKPEQVPAELKAIYSEVKDKGPGGHIL